MLPVRLFVGLVALAVLAGGSAATQGADEPATVLGGTWNFSAASTGNRVEISLSGLPPDGLGASDITVAFDSAVLQITSCDAGDLSGACNSNAPGGPALSAGFAVPAITTEPVVIASLIFDCVATSDASSTLTITINELVAGTGQPIPATAENGTVTCASDSDGDGVPDGQDNCPAWPNPAQNLPPWTIPVNDADCDGFTTTIESFVGTDPNDPCADTATWRDERGPEFSEPLSPWPPDVNDDGWTNLFDALAFSPSFNTISGQDPNYSVRFDLNTDGRVTLFDVLHISPFFNKFCDA